MSSPKKPFEKEIYGPPYQPEGSGKGGMVQEGDDIPEDKEGASRKTLGDYLSNLTKTAPTGNHYPIDAGTKEAPSHRDISGSPPVYVAFKDGGGQQTGAEKTFLDEALEVASGVDGALRADDFVLTGRSTYKNPDVSAGILSMEEAGDGSRVYAKGVGATRGTGHTLFSGIQEVVGAIEWMPGKGYSEDEVGSHDIQKRVSKILQNNRFHPTKSSPYILDGEFTSGAQGTLGSVQRTLGQYDPASKGISARDLMDIGRKIMVAGTGHTASESEFLAGLNPLTQIGIPFINVPTSKLDASNILDEIGGTGASAGARSSLLNQGGESAKGIHNDENKTGQVLRGALGSPGDSYGHLNSYYEPFSGALPFGMIMVGLAGMVSLLVQAAVVIGMIELINIIPSADPLRRNANNPLTLPKGRRQQLRSYAALVGPVMTWLGVPELESNKGLFGCCLRGIGTFYNVPNLDGVPGVGEFMTMMESLTEQGGFVASVIRSATRDLEQVVNVALPMMRGSAMTIIGGIIEIIKNLGNSNAVKFLMICVRLGDLMQVGDTWQFSPLRSHPDLLERSGTTRLAKSRTSYRDQTLVWSHSALPSAFLLPKSLAVAAATYGLQQGMGHSAVQNPSFLKEGRLAGKDQIDPVTGRITGDHVKAIEDKLEFEYVPFYFQDLRTNEIIAFHAFLSGITDDYSPSYNSVGGYGRMDKVQIYESTERSISFSFHVISTNPDDFDSMWYSVNKLVTMVYPQWSGGTVMKSADDKKFVMPFSQIPAASPMIRLRIGDLIKTNYSRFNLARIFGIGHGDKADGTFHVAGTDKNPDFANFDPAKPDVWAYFEKLAIPPIDPSDTDNGYADGAEAWLRPGEYSIKDAKDGAPSTIKTDKYTIIKIKEKAWPGMVFIPFLTSPLPHPPPYLCTLSGDSDKGNAGDAGEVEFWVDHATLVPYWKQVLADVPSFSEILPAEVEENDVSKWFTPESNSIVRSFESTKGRGLAGFITSLSFNHQDATWETRRLGSRAPMWMQVDVSFQPVHDLPPGIDEFGFNRAPLYNVGDVMNNLSGPDIHSSNLLNPEDDTVKAFNEDRSRLLASAPKKADSNGSEGNEG